MSSEVPAVPFDRWRCAMRDVAGTEADARAWREHRYQFAHRLGVALAGPGPDGTPALTGHVVYGVWLEWGVVYVGQTVTAQRRLKDLAVGESHHLANTFPPEIWRRVAVVAWPQLPEAAEALERFSAKAVGEGLEYRLQSWLQPLANASRRKSDGTWRAVDWERSNSVGARTGRELDELFAAVQRVWTEAAQTRNGRTTTSASRVVFPAQLL